MMILLYKSPKIGTFKINTITPQAKTFFSTGPFIKQEQADQCGNNQIPVMAKEIADADNDTGDKWKFDFKLFKQADKTGITNIIIIATTIAATDKTIAG